jgi:hypothetical protein
VIRSKMAASTSSAPQGDRKAYLLPAKIPSWEPLHLAFRHANLPNLPKIHDPHIWAVLQNASYEKSSKPSGHSIKTLAWCGDAVLLLSSTKACLKAGLLSGNHRVLQVSLFCPSSMVSHSVVDTIEYPRRPNDQPYFLLPHPIVQIA